MAVENFRIKLSVQDDFANGGHFDTLKLTEVAMGEQQRANNNDNDIDIVESERRNNDIDNDNVWRRNQVLGEISKYRLDRIDEFLFAHNVFMSDCADFVNPAIKQIERFMDVWSNLSDNTRKNIVNYRLYHPSCGRRRYNEYLNTPLWKYQASILKLYAHFTCEMCGNKFSPNVLRVHHKTYEHIGSEIYYPDDMQVLCVRCHMAVHNIGGKNEC